MKTFLYLVIGLLSARSMAESTPTANAAQTQSQPPAPDQKAAPTSGVSAGSLESKVENHPTQQPPPTSVFFYYCQKSNSYYPSVSQCDEGWIAVPAGPAVPVPYVEPAPKATQETVKSQPNAVSFEIFGRAYSYSLDYDRAISDHISLGAGISSWESRDWWHDYDATITVVPIYANYYFSQNPGRGFVSVGVDWISVTQAGFNDTTFANNGFAAVAGGGYEIRDVSGFLLRLGGFLIVGRSVSVVPLASIGFGF